MKKTDEEELWAADSGGPVPHQDTSDAAAHKPRGRKRSGRSILEQADDDTFSFSLKAILNGQWLVWMRHHVAFMMFLLLLTVVYVSNRYAAEKELIEIASMRQELEDIRFRYLTVNSELTRETRASYIEQRLRENGDSALHAPVVAPYVVTLKK